MRRLLLLVALLGVAACDVDLFGTDRRAIVGGYRLQAWEDGRYFLRAPDDTADSFVPLSVDRIGWDRDHILLLWPGRGRLPDRWSVVDVRARRMRDSVSRPTIESDPALRRIRTISADSAWRGFTVGASGA